MQFFSELLKYGVFQTITSSIVASILAIIVVFITKNHETKINQDTFIFEKKREAFSNILSLITNIIISIQSNFDWEENKYYWIGEKDCDDFQITAQKEMLYLSDDDISAIQLITKVLRKNSSWQSNIMNWEESVGFVVKDIALIEHLYKILTDSFRKQLFNKQMTENKYSTLYLEISYLFNDRIIEKKIINKDKFSKFNYTKNTIIETINNCNNNISEFCSLLEEIIMKYRKRKENNNYDNQIIDELSDLLQKIKK